MSIVRFGYDSNVYIFEDVAGGLNCCGCSLLWETMESTLFDTAFKMIEHLGKHLDAGQKVPGYVFTQILLNYPKINETIK